MMGSNPTSHDLASYCRLPTVTLEALAGLDFDTSEALETMED